MQNILEQGYIIIPARNEEKNIPYVINGILEKLNIDRKRIILVDNGSTDNTYWISKEQGIIVLQEPKIGYGSACLAAIDYIKTWKVIPDWIVIMDADFSDYPSDLERLILSYSDTKSDLVIGSRLIKKIEDGAMSRLQIFGNRLTCQLLYLIYKKRFTDLGSLRLIKYQSFLKMNLSDATWGWNIEMQIRAIQNKFKILEIPVQYRKRKFGTSKISGSFLMSLRVGIKILYIFFKLVFLEKLGFKSK